MLEAPKDELLEIFIEKSSDFYRKLPRLFSKSSSHLDRKVSQWYVIRLWYVIGCFSYTVVSHFNPRFLTPGDPLLATLGPLGTPGEQKLVREHLRRQLKCFGFLVFFGYGNFLRTRAISFLHGGAFRTRAISYVHRGWVPCVHFWETSHWFFGPNKGNAK